MAAKAILVLFVVACSLSSLHAWSWSKKAKTAPTVIDRKELLARVAAAGDDVDKAVQESHDRARAADDANTEAAALAQVDQDIAEWAESFESKVYADADAMRKKGVQDASCLERFQADMANIKSAWTASAKKIVKDDSQDVRNTVADADALLEKMEALEQRAEAEAAKPDGEYGAGVAAILAETDAVLKKATWNNGHITAMLNGLKFSADLAMDDTDAKEDAIASRNYYRSCRSG